jgi:hypothetical protein
MPKQLQILLAVAAFLSLACERVDQPSTPRGKDELISVGANTALMNDSGHVAQSEYFGDADPSNPNHLAVCTMVIDPRRSRLTTAIYTSDNKGANWRLAFDDTISRYGQSWDPACAYGPGGILYFATLPHSTDPRVDVKDQTRFYRSTDNGKTWSAAVVAPFLDNEDFAVDWTDGPNRGRVYVAGVRVDESQKIPRRYFSVLYSTDSGKTYKGPVDWSVPDSLYQGTVAAPVVLNDGRVMVPAYVARRDVVWEPNKPRSPSDTSWRQWRVMIPVLDGGSRVGAPITVAKFENCPGNSGGPPVIAVDRSKGPFRNRIYYAYTDGSFGRCQIMLTWSDDGTKWSKPIGVDDPRIPTDTAKGPDAFLPQIGVNKNGVVGLTWYDRREDPRNLAFRQRFTASLDGGESVLPSVPVSTAAHTYAQPADREGYFGLGSGVAGKGTAWMAVVTGGAYRTYDEVGDYGAFMVGSDGTFYPVWVDNRSGAPQLNVAPVVVKGTAKRRSEWDAGLGTNVSDSIKFIITSSAFDPKSCSIALGFDVMNRSQRPVSLPLTIRAERMFSQFGVPRATSTKTDGMGRALWNVGKSGTLARDSVVSDSTKVTLDDCTNLGGSVPRRRKLDARMNATPVAGFAGPKMFAMEATVFEAKR